ncbi:DEAD/DEAH box helicase [Sediminimonas sp.]|uniref:SNF2-related protein n=1 Tax=Sediminimonas sp. TaxID=2823379 RepID=UPI0025D983F5|nr:DEAD/DEAH box helicase [Sediminimonas sp.]
MNGQLQFAGDRIEPGWVVSNLKPHVSMRFKDVFKGIPFGSVPPFFLRDRPSIAADLDWFMQRYPLSMDRESEGWLSVQLKAYRDAQARIEEIHSTEYTPPVLTGFRDGEEPMTYQRRAADLLRTTGRLLLLDDVGLGKTVSALAAISDGWGLPAAVVVQPHLSTQWVVQYIERFTHLRAVEIKDRNARQVQVADIYVFRYSNIAAWVDMIEPMGVRTVIFDEIQELRHGQATEKGRAAASICSVVENRLGLTATPIYNYGSEIFNVVEYIAPGALGTWGEFLTNWCTSHGTHWIVKEPEALGAFLQEEGVTLRRTNEDAEVASVLPGLSKTVIEVDWDDGAVQSDRDLQEKLALQVLSGSFHNRGVAARELNMMLRHETGVAKARAVAAYIRTLVEGGEPVLVGAWHREVYDILLDRLADLRPAMFTGSESAAAKRRARQAFIDGDTNIMLMSLRSGAGIDGLQSRASHVVYAELDWSPQVHVQFTGRLHRHGQERPVIAHFLHVNGGSDPAIMSTLGLKASQSHGILNPYGGQGDATPVDESRIRQLAKSILEQEARS